jgi:hypothetical protein
LLGVATRDSAGTHSESIWIAPNPVCEEIALKALLTVLRRQALPPHRLTLNYPAGQGTNAFEQVGFLLHNTLIWMRINFGAST